MILDQTKETISLSVIWTTNVGISLLQFIVVVVTAFFLSLSFCEKRRPLTGTQTPLIIWFCFAVFLFSFSSRTKDEKRLSLKNNTSKCNESSSYQIVSINNLILFMNNNILWLRAALCARETLGENIKKST